MRPTNPLWYLAAFLLALGSVMLGAIVAAGAWDPVREATISPTSVRADAAGRSLAVFTDIVQPEREIRCRTITRDKQSMEVPPPALDIMVDEQGNQWHLIGLLPQGSNDVKVRCAPRDKRVDNASYGWATVSGFESRGDTGAAIGWIGTGVGAVFAGYVFASRRRQRKETRREPA